MNTKIYIPSPRAATSVATRIGALPLLKSALQTITVNYEKMGIIHVRY